MLNLDEESFPGGESFEHGGELGVEGGSEEIDFFAEGVEFFFILLGDGVYLLGHHDKLL